MNVLVTGGAGFIGSHIVDALINQGHSAIVVDNLTGGSVHKNPNTLLYNLDICSKELDQVFKENQIDCIIHVAAQVSVPNSIANPLDDARTNILGGINLLECYRKYKVKKFIYNSSGGAIAGDPDIFPILEEHHYAPISPYGVSKLSFEYYLNVYHKIHNLSFVTLRYSNVYGPRQDCSGEGGVIATFAQRFLDNKSPIVFGDGKQTRDFVFVKDVVKANLLAINHSICTSYNICQGEEVTINELISTMNQATGISLGAEFAEKREGDIHRSFLSREKAAKKLGWKPEYSLLQGVQELITYLKKPKENNGVIIVLGAANDEKGNLSNQTLERCNKALEVLTDNPNYKLLLTGGFGSHFNLCNEPHSLFVKKHIISKGISEDKILPLVESNNTKEDAYLSKKALQDIIDNNTNLVVITSDYHLPRAKHIFSKVFSDHDIKFVASTTKISAEEHTILHQNEIDKIQAIQGQGTVAIIQARMGSTRLPGKVLMLIGNQPVLSRVYEQVKKVVQIDQVIVATSTESKDDAIAEYCENNNIVYFRGDEHDVLKRFYNASVKHNPKLVVRICCDQPLLDYNIIEQSISKHRASGNDYNSTFDMLPKGTDTEIFSFESLEHAHFNAQLPEERRHVTKYIYSHPEIFKVNKIKFNENLSRPDIVITLDTEEDYRFICSVYDKLGPDANCIEKLIQAYNKGIISR